MEAARLIRRLEGGWFHSPAGHGVVEVIQGEVIDKVATRD
jgi:hypothetical protein